MDRIVCGKATSENLDYDKVKLGFCPIGKFVFSHEDAVAQKKKIEEHMMAMGVRYVGADAVLEDGMVRGYEDAEKVVRFFKDQSIDGLFLPHCNFGTESAAGLIARDVGKPVLLWGPRDGAPLPDGTRLRDSLCGLFASSKVLVKLKVPFTYIENCHVSDPPFTEGLDRFLRAVCTVSRVRGARIGMIGNRIDFFWSTIMDESDLLQRFGIEVLPVDLVRIIRRTRELAGENRIRYKEESEALGRQIDITLMGQTRMDHVLGLRDALLEFAGEHHLAALAVESFMSLVEELGACVSASQALVSDRGIPCICESDIHGAVSAVAAEAAILSGSPSFFADLTVRHPDNENGLLLWHDAFPLSLKDPKCRGSLGSHWILPGFEPGMCHWRLKPGEITIVRFDGERGDYRFLARECVTTDGPFTQNTYVWVNVPGYREFERQVIEGPYIHHTACVYGKAAGVLKEAAKYLGMGFDG